MAAATPFDQYCKQEHRSYSLRRTKSIEMTTWWWLAWYVTWSCLIGPIEHRVKANVKYKPCWKNCHCHKSADFLAHWNIVGAKNAVWNEDAALIGWARHVTTSRWSNLFCQKSHCSMWMWIHEMWIRCKCDWHDGVVNLPIWMLSDDEMARESNGRSGTTWSLVTSLSRLTHSYTYTLAANISSTEFR